MDDISNKKYLSKRFTIRCICLTLMFLAGSIFAVVILEPFWLNILKDKIIFDVQNLNATEADFLNTLINTNKVHTADFVFERMIHFYESLITIIVGISAVFGVIGYLYIKNSHQRDIYEGIHSLFNSHIGINLLENIITTNAKKHFTSEFNKSLNDGELKNLQVITQNNAEEIETILNRLNIIETQLEKIPSSINADTNKIEVSPNDPQKEIIIPEKYNNIAIEVDTEKDILTESVIYEKSKEEPGSPNLSIRKGDI